MRKKGLLEIENLISENKNVVFIGSDLGPDVLSDTKKNYPDQFFMEGISEAHVLGMASGLAMDGYIVYVNTIATFFVKRALEQLALDICAENLNVRLYSNGGGLVYGPLGHTHTCVDDFSILQSLPHLTILAPADENEMKSFIKESLTHQGPIYIRLAKGGDRVVSQKQDIRIGHANLYGKEKGDILFISTGVMLQRCLEVSESLKGDCHSSVLHYATMRPFDDSSLLSYIDNFDSVIVVEEHMKNGGLGSTVSRVLFENKKTPNFYKHFHLGESYPMVYGRQEEILDYMGVTTENILSVCREIIS
ncbi:hypothetical protein BIY24_14905 [Halobacteriovorax marinus]|uniref:transketolase family protein n=1 Tax=Halobacteriovorax marinus TaxID=97084 RepID=UPI000BC33ECF|nr:transketolase C-terminal domain-containing protein [Halobacteriovorax marinus]ATH09187.1 hypothetical protein BIY24_14905 [Halobacteriovorax marinus]